MKKIDLADVLTFGGLLVAGAGIWMLSPAWALIVMGTALFGIGIRASW